ncbi:MAG TPA: hypothetical protein VMT91_08065 [Anaerolineales bacterium]|nr:hypothetical protein [Anaerolineales bacterium]
MNAKPIPETYWVLPGSFLAGAYPLTALDETVAHLCMASFLEAGLNSFIDLTSPGELPPYLPVLQQESAHYGIPVDYQRLVIQDKGLPSREQMAACLDAVDAALAAGRKVYLHCWGGIGRTGTVVGCWLVRHGLAGRQALLRLNELYQASAQSHLYPHSPETAAQVAFILGWTEDGLA